MIGDKSNFLSLAATQRGSVALENGRSGTIASIGKIGESISHLIDNVYLVDGSQHKCVPTV